MKLENLVKQAQKANEEKLKAAAAKPDVQKPDEGVQMEISRKILSADEADAAWNDIGPAKSAKGRRKVADKWGLNALQNVGDMFWITMQDDCPEGWDWKRLTGNVSAKIVAKNRTMANDGIQNHIKCKNDKIGQRIAVRLFDGVYVPTRRGKSDG